MQFTKTIIITLAATAAVLNFSSACDVCGCYNPPQETVSQPESHFYTGVAEQFTYFGTDRVDGHKVDNPTGQHMDSSITQFVIGYSFSDRFGVQVNLPYIFRSYQRPQGFAIETGHEQGIGDVSLLANYFVFNTESSPRKKALTYCPKDSKNPPPMEKLQPDFAASLNLIGGVKMPTGNSSRIKEEFSEMDIDGAPASGIHGHDLTLGTGSWDVVMGAQFLARYKAFFMEANAQFTLRGASPYSYHFANELSWDGGPGWYFFRRQDASFAVQFVVSGEYKGTDTFQSQSADDTGVTAVYLGPRLLASFGRITAEAGVDLPVLMHTTAFQTTPDYRIRAGFSYRF